MISAKYNYPVESSLPQIRSSLADSADVILSASPGAGKSTIVPLALKDESWLAGQRIIILQPRRIAAVALARRMAFLDGSSPGAVIGHQVRFDSNLSASTRIEVVTEGILTRRLQKDPLLEGVGLVIFDEFHERSVHTDLCLALCREIKREVRPDLRLMLMSATADLELAQSFLDQPQLVQGKGFLHPVEVHYRPVSDGRDHIGALARSIEQIIAESGAGEEFLVFLPGIGEIRQVADFLECSRTAVGRQIMILHGSLAIGDQEKILQPATRPRIILSTNIAETSLTIDGITRVIDSGLARWLEIDAQSGLEQLQLHRISRSSATQRAGRAGRVKPGQAFRLWSLSEHQQMAENDQPEILRIDPTAAVLELYAWGCRNPLQFNWLQSPGSEKIGRSVDLLRLLGAVDETGKITADGRRMSELPVEPRLARMLLTATVLGIAETAALAAAIIGEKDFVKRSYNGAGVTKIDADLDWRLQLLADNRSADLPVGIETDRGAIARIFKVQRQLLDLLGKAFNHRSEGVRQQLHQSFLAAFPDRVCMRRTDDSSGSFTICSGQGLSLNETGLLPGERLILAFRLDLSTRPGSADGRIFLACGLEENLLKTQALYQPKREIFFSEVRAKVLARERVWYGKLLLSDCESALKAEECYDAGQLLMDAALASVAKAMACVDEKNQEFINRVAALKACPAGAGFPALDNVWLTEQIHILAPGSRSFADLQKQTLEQLYLQQLSWKNREFFEKLVPESFVVPSGSAIRIQYQSAGSPILAVRIQELFGMHQTPTICNGQLSLLLHLLSPAGHPVQITADLVSFWQSGYQQVVKELKGRYPKHQWPDDPSKAIAFRGTKKQLARKLRS
ncbi:MAG: ATP-dependent helicase HrpB [Candidatus Riflebacteria bacterium]|nr:ATP-dependent helicase HrpB [Candidatus Riflebacteria bacterium]